jgi:hypothetical protein
MALERAELDESGLRGDRLLFVAGEDGVALTQEELPRMLLIRPKLVDRELTVEAPERAPLAVRVSERGETRHTEHWHDAATAIDQGDAAARWFSEFLGVSCRLFASDAIRARGAPERYRGIISAEQRRFAAVAPLLLTSEASLADLNARLAKPIRMERFRQNLVVAGSPAFHEEWWSRVRVGDLELERVASCERCAVTQLDPETAERGIEPIRTLAKYRRQPGGISGGIVFGVYFRPLGAGSVKRGDALRVLDVQRRFVPNDSTANVAEREAPTPPADL